MTAKAKEWSLKEQRLAARLAGSPRDSVGVDCGEIGRVMTYTGAAGFFTSLVPGVGQVAVFVSGATTLGGLAAQLGADAGLC